MSTTDRIEKQVILRAPRARVWRALTNAEEFGENMTMTLYIDRIEPESLFSYRWHPYAVDPKVDYTSETPTLVEFRLEDAEGGTRLSIVESGFDALPAARRDEAFRMNDGGWTAQGKNLASYVESK